MQAVVLAAGKGNRISDVTQGLPKSYLKLNEETLIERNLRLLREHGVSQIVLVTGYQRQRFAADHGAADVRCVFNPFFEKANVLASFWCAVPELSDDFIYLHADTVFDNSILADIIKHPGDFVLACDTKPCGDEEMKYRQDGGYIVELSKGIEHGDAHGEFMGLAKISRQHIPGLRDFTEAVLERGEFNAFFEAAIQEFINAHPHTVVAMDTGDRPWVEIDFPEDYKAAQAAFSQS